PPPGSLTLSLHDALPILVAGGARPQERVIVIVDIAGRVATKARVDASLALGSLHIDVGQHHLAKGAVVKPVVAHPPVHQRTLRRSEEHTSELQSRENLVC